MPTPDRTAMTGATRQEYAKKLHEFFERNPSANWFDAERHFASPTPEPPSTNQAAKQQMDRPTPFVKAALKALPPQDRYDKDEQFGNFVKDIVRLMGIAGYDMEDLRAAIALVPSCKVQQRDEKRKHYEDLRRRVLEGSVFIPSVKPGEAFTYRRTATEVRAKKQEADARVARHMKAWPHD